jgi:hypothetical protein
VTALRVISPSGSNGAIQFKSQGDFDGDATFTFAPAAKRLTLLGTGSFSALSGSLTQLENGDPYLHAGTNISLATGSDGSITIAASGAGGSTIGNAEDGSYEDGLFTDFISSTAIGTAVDRFNEILKLLVPSPAPDLDDIDVNSDGVDVKLSFGASNNQASASPAYVTVSNTAGLAAAVDVNGDYVTATSSNNLRAAAYNGSTDIIGDLNEDVARNVTSPSSRENFPANSFGNAEVGSLVLEVNGANLYTLDLTDNGTGTGNPGSGTANHVNGNGSGFINFSVKDAGEFDSGTSFPTFQHRTGQYKVAVADQRNGWNYARVKHNKGATTVNSNYAEWVNDNNADALSVASNSLVFTGQGSTHLSGVEYFTSGQGRYQVTVSNAYKYVYDGNNITFTTSNGGTTQNITYNAANLAKPSINTGGGETHTKQIQIDQTDNITGDYILGGSVTCGVNVTHPLKANLNNSGQATASGILMYNLNNTSTDTSETFHRENFRIQAGTYADQASVTAGGSVWNSQTVMLDGNAGHLDGLQFFNKTLVSPLNSLNSGDFRDNGDGGPLTTSPSSNVNYSGISGDRTFYRRFRNTSGATAYDLSLTIQGTGTIVANNAALNGNKLRVFIKLPQTSAGNETGFLDTAGEFVSGSIANNNGGHTANGGLSFDSSLNATNYIVLGTAGIQNNDYVVVKIVANSSWTGNISNIAVSFAAGTGVIAAVPDLDDIDCNNTGVEAKLSFGAAKSIAGYSDSSTGAGFSAVDVNGAYSTTTNGNNLRRAVFNKTVSIEGDLNEDVAANSPDYVANAFSDANQGTLKLEVNGALIRQQVLGGAYNTVGAGEPGSGTGTSLDGDGSGFINLSVWRPSEFDNEIPYYPEVYRTGKFRITAASQRNGWNYARVIHTVGGADRTTNYVEWVNDNDSNALTTSSSEALASFTDDTLNHLSGVKYFTQPTAVYSATISNIYKNVYSSSASAISFTALANAAATRIQQSGAGLTGAKNTAAATDSLQSLSTNANSQNETLGVQGTVQFSRAKSLPGTYTTAYNASAAMVFVHPLKSNLTTSTLTKTNLLVYTVSNTSNANTDEHFTSENYRVQAGTYANQASVTAGGNAWNSQTSVNDNAGNAGHATGLILYDGMAISPLDGGNAGDFRNHDDGGNIAGPPSNVNYTSLTHATRDFYRGFLNNTVNDRPSVNITIYGDATIVGKTGASQGVLGSNKNVFVEVKVPGKTGFLDLGKPSEGAGNTSDGDGCLSGDLDATADGSGATNACTFNGQTTDGTASSAEYFIVKVSAHKDWSGYINRISVAWS